MKSNSILSFMIQDHEKIIKLLDMIESNVGQNFESMLRSFNNFEWNFEKHLFVEERAIFASDIPTDITIKYPIILELLEEHIVLLDILTEMRKDLLRKHTIDYSKFRRLLINHKDFEEENVYPKLDLELDNSQKNLIFDRINEFT